MNGKVVAIVVTYNRKDLLLECIRHKKHSIRNLDILIIDNASSDGTKLGRKKKI